MAVREWEGRKREKREESFLTSVLHINHWQHSTGYSTVCLHCVLMYCVRFTDCALSSFLGISFAS